MLKMTTSRFVCPFACIERLVQIQPLVFLLTLMACLGSLHLSGSATAQLATDSIEGDFVSVLGTESDLMWEPYLAESTQSESGVAGPDCCPETSEQPWLKENRSLCTIKCALGGTKNVAIRPEDEIWIVSARNFDSCLESAESLEVKRLANNTWQVASIDELAECHQSNTSLTTLLYAHGNQTDYNYGISRGVQFYRSLASCPELDGPIRMVLWLWKSERESVRLYPDFRIKSERAIEMGAAFRTTLERLGDSRVALVGFSLGAQVILSALDSMEEHQSHSFCEWDCSSLQGSYSSDSDTAKKYRIALIAPALDPAYACAAAGRTVCSSITHETRIFNNRSDRAVKALRIIIRRECPQKSISFSKLVAEQRLRLGRVTNVDITSEAGARHSIVRYSRTQSLCCELGRLLSEVANKKILADQPVLDNHFTVE